MMRFICCDSGRISLPINCKINFQVLSSAMRKHIPFSDFPTFSINPLKTSPEYTQAWVYGKCMLWRNQTVLNGLKLYGHTPSKLISSGPILFFIAILQCMPLNKYAVNFQWMNFQEIGLLIVYNEKYLQVWFSINFLLTEWVIRMT